MHLRNCTVGVLLISFLCIFKQTFTPRNNSLVKWLIPLIIIQQQLKKNTPVKLVKATGCHNFTKLLNNLIQNMCTFGF